MQVIEGLLRIKRIREDSREAEMRRARQQLEQAAEALRRATELRHQRDRERAERERAMYAEVCARVVVVRELDDLRLQVATMKTAAQVDAQAVVDAQTQRQARRDAFEQAAAAWRTAAQATRKFADLAAEDRDAKARHVEWLADLELEEFAGRGLAARAIEDEPQAA